MTDALIEMAQSEIHDINNEIGIQNEKFMSLEKTLDKGSEVLRKNLLLLHRLNNAAQMKHIFNFMFVVIFIVCIFLTLLHHEIIIGSMKHWLIKN